MKLSRTAEAEGTYGVPLAEVRKLVLAAQNAPGDAMVMVTAQGGDQHDRINASLSVTWEVDE